MSAKKVLVFAGSARKGSVNKKFASVAAEATKAAGATVTLIDLADFPAPVYDGDIETSEGLPKPMQDLKALIAGHDGLLIVTPEYNGCAPPLLVNMFAWTSRPQNDEISCAAYANKPVAIAAASPGGLGGVRVIPRLRDALAELGAVAVPGFATLPGAFQAFNDDGTLKDEKAAGMLKGLAERLVAAL
jgi:NAD(P)H-dependent FMN reductase